MEALPVDSKVDPPVIKEEYNNTFHQTWRSQPGREQSGSTSNTSDVLSTSNEDLDGWLPSGWGNLWHLKASLPDFPNHTLVPEMVTFPSNDTDVLEYMEDEDFQLSSSSPTSNCTEENMVLSEASNDSGSTYKQCLFNCQLWNLQKTRCLYPFVLIRTKRALPSFKIPPVFTKLTRPSFTVFGQGFHGFKNKYGTGRGPRFPGGKIRRGPLDGGRRPTRPHLKVFGPRKTPIGGGPSVPSVPKPESGGLDLQHKSPLPNVQRDTFGFPSSRVLPRNIKTIRLQRRRSPALQF